MTAERQPEHRRNPRLEALLDEISGLLGPVESEVAARYHMPAYPVVLVMGLPRCGSTLTMQWLAASGRFGYPSNLLSRFYAAPYVGARIQQLLTDPQFSFGDELHDLAGAVGSAIPLTVADQIAPGAAVELLCCFGVSMFLGMNFRQIVGQDVNTGGILGQE